MSANDCNRDGQPALPPATLLGQFWRMDYIPCNKKAALEIEGDRYGLDHPWAGMWIVCPKDEEHEGYGVYAASEDYAKCKSEFEKLEASGALP